MIRVFKDITFLKFISFIKFHQQKGKDNQEQSVRVSKQCAQIEVINFRILDQANETTKMQSQLKKRIMKNRNKGADEQYLRDVYQKKS